MKEFLLREAKWFIIAILIISFITFCLCRVAPGDPIQIRCPKADPEQIAQIHRELGLDKPLPIQYALYMWNFIQGDMSMSLYYLTPVKELLFPALWISFQINLLALLIALPLGLILGIIAAKNRGKWLDSTIIISSLIPRAIPSIIFILFAVLVFACILSIFPLRGWNGIFSTKIIIPLIVLSLPAIGGFAEFVRVNILHVLDDEYIRTAYAKGLPEWRVLGWHVLPNASTPIVTVVIISLAELLVGSLFVEMFYGIPGSGKLMFDAFFNRDYELMMAFTIFISAAFLILVRVADLSIAVIDKRVRLGAAQH
ncbi:MAG: hypothetical protein COV69_03395 [Parcubacteria group bacterium CG11_big_fil_rev_8_21_14_0_20_39_14]|nr:MAG: hypothetical protein COV69_03395 [Parcubacteria group bacterium CG11_big_fil_rev_8_21_14_0_20_39_14]PIS35803.1 MAG: hypothetical protein COT36_00440 [Parcubacteria group bacterium CG08_land_8_20_14_0_20_38_56]